MQALVAIAALIAIVWGVALALRGSLVIGCLAYIFAACCLGHPLVHFDVGPLPVTIDRLLLACLMAAYGVQRGVGRTDPKPMTRDDWALVIFVGYLTVSTFIHDWRVTREDQISPIWRLAGGYVFPLIVYWIARQSRLTDGLLRAVQLSIVAFGVYLGFTGVMEIAGQWAFVFPQYIADPEVGLHFGRARGPMVHAVTFGHYLAIAILAAWAALPGLSRFGQLTLFALSPALLAGVYFCYTRSVWMGLALGVAVVLWLSLEGRWRPLVLGTMAAAAILVGAVKFQDMVELKREGNASDSKLSAVMRGGFAYVSWQMFKDRPLAGFGFGQFPEAKLPYLSDRSIELNLEVLRPAAHHNHWLSVLTETGLVGLVLYFLVLAGWTRSAWRLARSEIAPAWAKRQGVFMLGAMAVYLCQSAFHELSYNTLDHSLLFCLAGLTAGLAPLARGEPTEAIGDIRDELPHERVTFQHVGADN